MSKEIKLPYPMCLVDLDLDCTEKCHMLQEAMNVTLQGAIKAGVTIEEYKQQVRQFTPFEKAQIRSINRQVAKAEGVFDLCANHDITKSGIGFDQ